MDEKKPTWEELAQQPWVLALKGVLQFVGGGLAAMRRDEQESPQDQAEHESRQTLARMGITTDHAEAVRKSWSAASRSKRVRSADPEQAVTRMSFDDFVRGAAELGLNLPDEAASPTQHGAPATPIAGPGAQTEPEPDETSPPARGVRPAPRLLEELVQSAPPARSPHEATPWASASGPDAENGASHLEERDRLTNERIAELESRLQALTELLLASGGGEIDEVPNESNTSGSNIARPIDAPEHDLPPHGADPREHEMEDGPSNPRPDGETIVVQGPWLKGYPESTKDQNVSVVASPNAREQRIDQLEHTLGTFEKMVEGLLARTRAKGAPSH